MKLSITTDSLGTLDFHQMLQTAAEFGIQGLEFATGNWSPAPHLDLDKLLESEKERKAFLTSIEDAGLEIVALNCSGNPLAPNASGKKHREVTEKTFKLANMLGVETIVMMSGLPGGSPEDTTPTWIITSWPPENVDVLKWQWNERLIPFWEEMVAIAEKAGIKKIALENHGAHLVYNAATLKRLHEAVGPMVGMNLDPSHLFWMGADPRYTARELGSLIYHVHAKDVRLEQGLWQTHGFLDTQGIDKFANRSWNYVALGHGHDLTYWKDFFSILTFEGYTGPVSLEMEDMSMDQITGVAKSLEVLKAALPHRFV
jgi:sugar phosphate isomerase/epimerase